jgi:hypothetical protein
MRDFHARHRVRHAMTTGYKYSHIFITDAKRLGISAYRHFMSADLGC